MESRRLMLGLGMLIVLAAGILLPACGPVDNETLALLPADKAMQLKTWSTNHAIVFDPRLHSMETCPFLTYLPAASVLRGKEWADWAWKFYGAKHREENHCTCDATLVNPQHAAK